ncbi:MAG: phosphoglucosamine mutase [Candidatus Thorarchaeota archaeon]
MGQLFGTNGVRGLINKDFTSQVVMDLGRAIGTVLGPGNMTIARDVRMGGMMFSYALVSGLLSTGCSVVEIGLAATPVLQFAVCDIGCQAGVVVTASHNPPEYNGLKVMGSNGVEVSRDVENTIEEVYFSKRFRQASWPQIGTHRRNQTSIHNYVEAMKTHVETEKIAQRKLTVVIDCGNSVGALTTPRLLRDLGCRVISLNSQLDGNFPSRNPEPLPENLGELQNTVLHVGADIGIAHDGDADRSTFVDETGEFVAGDQSFALLVKHLLSGKKRPILVTPVSSGQLIEDVANQVDAEIIWTEVGSVVVTHKLIETNGDFGGEENGGVFYPPHQPVRDGAMTAALVLDAIVHRDLTLSEIVRELPVYHTKKTKIPVPPEKKDDILNAILSLTEDENRVTLDGVKIVYENGWILLRPSGTESLWRIFSESSSEASAEQLCSYGIDILNQAIDTV